MKWLLLIILLMGCGDDGFIEQSELIGLRVLTVEADTPEINAAATVTLTPLISYVDGGNTILDYTWEACPDPGISFGADANCDNAPVALKQSGAATFNTAGLAASYFTGNATSIAINIPASYFVYLATLDSKIQFNGLDYIVFINYADQANANSINAFKRIKLSTKTNADLNTNPSFLNIQFNGSNLVAFPTAVGDMSISGRSAAENYAQDTNIGLRNFTEDMSVSWYSSAGEFLFIRRDPDDLNEYTPSGSTGVFVAVFRDGRGGVTSQVISF